MLQLGEVAAGSRHDLRVGLSPDAPDEADLREDEAGASGYVLKDAEADDVAAAIRAAHAGEIHLAPAVAGVLARRVRQGRSVAARLGGR